MAKIFVNTSISNHLAEMPNKCGCLLTSKPGESKYLLLRLLRNTLLLVSACIFLLTPLSAFASDYYVVGWEKTSSGGSYRWTGGHAYIYVIPNPAVIDKHINAVFMVYSNSNPLQMSYEVGWKKDVGVSTVPISFATKMLNGEQTKYNGPVAAQGTWPLYSVQVDSNEPNAPARMKVGNSTIYTQTPAMFPDANIWYSSERDSIGGDTNNGKFDHLMRRNHSFGWNLFTNNQRLLDNDWYYHLSRVSHSTAEIHTPNGSASDVAWWH